MNMNLKNLPGIVISNQVPCKLSHNRDLWEGESFIFKFTKSVIQLIFVVFCSKRSCPFSRLFKQKVNECITLLNGRSHICSIQERSTNQQAVSEKKSGSKEKQLGKSFEAAAPVFGFIMQPSGGGIHHVVTLFYQRETKRSPCNQLCVKLALCPAYNVGQRLGAGVPAGSQSCTAVTNANTAPINMD